MSEALGVAQDRIRRFERLGGIDLSSLHHEERHDLLAEVRSGIASYKKAVFRFRCSLCGNTATNDAEMSPACTGPSWRDEHPMEPMELIP